MGTLSSNYPNSNAVEAALNRANSAAHEITLLSEDNVDIKERLDAFADEFDNLADILERKVDCISPEDFVAGSYDQNVPCIINLNGTTVTLTETRNISNCYIFNGTIHFGNAADKQPSHETCLKVGTNVMIENITFEGIDAYYVVESERGASNIVVRSCSFFNNAFANLYFEVGNSNITVENCTFDGITYTDTSRFAYRYHIASGSKHLKDENSDYDFMIRDFKVVNNVVLNNPLWEGIDCHGGENVLIENNYIKNVRTGIMCMLDTRFIETPVHRNIKIANNVMFASETATSGIAVGGGGTFESCCDNIVVENNYIHGFNTTNNYEAGLRIRTCSNMRVSNNVICGAPINGILFLGLTTNIKINGNKINSTGDGVIVINTWRNINIDISENILNGLNEAQYSVYVNKPTKIKMSNNVVVGCVRGSSVNSGIYIGQSSVETAKTYVEYMQEIAPFRSPVSYYSNTMALCYTNDFDEDKTVTGTIGDNFVVADDGYPHEVVVGLTVSIANDVYTISDIGNGKIFFNEALTASYSREVIRAFKPYFLRKLSSVDATRGKNKLNLDKLLTERGVAYDKNGSEYSISLKSEMNTQIFYFSDYDVPIVISGNLTNITSTNARVSLVNKSGEIVNNYAIDASHNSTSGIACGIKFDWAQIGRCKIDELMVRFSYEDATYEEYELTLQEQIDELKQEIENLT